MGICKCYVSPNQGNFEAGRYYTWLKAVSKEKGISVSDNNKEWTVFSPKEYRRFFKNIQCANISMSIYIDRNRELLFVPEFKHKAGYRVSLDCFNSLSLPYREEDIGKVFLEVWQKYRRHKVVTAKEVEQVTPYYRLVTNGKDYSKFALNRWMISVDFIVSEKEMIFIYWYKKKGSAFGVDASDRRIDRIEPMSASCEDIGRTVIAIFEEAGILKESGAH